MRSKHPIELDLGDLAGLIALLILGLVAVDLAIDVWGNPPVTRSFSP